MPSQYPLSAREIHNAILSIKPTGELLFQDMGNVKGFALAPEVNRIPIYESEPGFKNKVDEVINEASYGYEFTIDEITLHIAKMLHLAEDLGDVAQAAAANLAVTANGVKKGHIIDLNREKVSNVVVTVGGVVKSPLIDYLLDAGAGTVKPRNSTTIAENSNWNITYDCAATTRRKLAPLQKIQQDGFVKIWLKDKYDTTRPAEIIQGEAAYWITDWGTQDLSGIREVKLQLRFRGTPDVTRR